MAEHQRPKEVAGDMASSDIAPADESPFKAWRDLRTIGHWIHLSRPMQTNADPQVPGSTLEAIHSHELRFYSCFRKGSLSHQEIHKPSKAPPAAMAGPDTTQARTVAAVDQGAVTLPTGNGC